MSVERRGRQRARRRGGFTLLEVMIAMVVLVLAVVGASSLMQVTTLANVTARNRAHATEYLQTWIERLKMDGMSWQAVNATPSLFTGRADNTWFRLSDADLNGLGSMKADYWGADLLDADVDAGRAIRYCVELRGELLAPGTLRADALVWWHREGGNSVLEASFTETLPDGGVVTVEGPIETDRNRFADCNRNGVDIFDDPRIYWMTASTTLVALD